MPDDLATWAKEQGGSAYIKGLVQAAREGAVSASPPPTPPQNTAVARGPEFYKVITHPEWCRCKGRCEVWAQMTGRGA